MTIRDERVEMNGIRGRVLAAVAPIYNVGPGQIAGPSRLRAHVRARWSCWMVLRRSTSLSLPQIGRMFGVDHTTVMHGLQQLQAKLGVDNELRARFEKALAVFNGNDLGDLPRLFIPWTAADHERAVSMFRENVPVTEIALELGRSVPAVRERMRAHSVATRKAKPPEKAPPPAADDVEDHGPEPRPFVDRLERCEAKWAKVLGGIKFPSLNIEPRPLVQIDPPPADVGAELMRS